MPVMMTVMQEVPKGMQEVIAAYGNNKVVEAAHGTCIGDPQWESENLVVLRNVGGTGLNIQLHHLVVTSFTKCLRRALSVENPYKVRMLGGYCARHQRNAPSNPLSIHAFGAAFDVNWDTNPMGPKLVTDLPHSFIEAFTEGGWTWGGDWSSIKDAMHFQLARGV